MNLYAPEAVYRLDQAAVAVDGFSEIELMRRAGERVWSEMIDRWPAIRSITVFAGSGNNGGDAFVVACCARSQGVDVQLIVQGDLERQSDTARHFRELWLQAGGQWQNWEEQELTGEVVVDGLLGIGLQRELAPDWQKMIAAINDHPGSRVAIDIPSGLNGLTGTPQPVAVDADLTVTFIGAKTGQFLADGPDYCGELVFDALGVSEKTRATVEPTLPVIERCRLPSPRRRNSHKNRYGHVLIVGGDRGMSGAVALAAHAALRSGAGLVTALVHPECQQQLAPIAEVMVLDWSSLDAKLEEASVIVVGPGLGDSEAALACLQKIRTRDLPMVIDASALRKDFVDTLASANAVITPHPGEAGRLLDIDAAQVQQDRLGACRELAHRYSVACILKGSGTLVARGEQIAVNLSGNPGMATAGMGDVLAGMVGAYLGQDLDAFDAACSAVHVHALTADLYTEDYDQTGLIASDVIHRIPRIVRRLRNAD